MKTFKQRFLFYLLTGAVWLMLWMFIRLINNPDTFSVHALNEIWRASYLIVANFIFFEYGLTIIRKSRSNILLNILIGIILVALQLIIVSFGLFVYSEIGRVLHIYTSLRHLTLIGGDRYDYLLDHIFYHAEIGVASIFFFWFAKLFFDNFNLRRTTQQLRLEKKEAELNYLKSQTNPHFLFNTLNNIYTLASDKSDLAPESILRLSQILRFMLYETGGEFIRAEQELEIIKDYIELEKLRYDDSLNIDFKYEVDDMLQKLPPLLLIPLVENAFKHGISQTTDLSFVEIYLSIDRQQLMFIVKNSTDALAEETGVKENIGLSNLRRQLQLLYTDYDLAVQQGELEFTVNLQINLVSHV